MKKKKAGISFIFWTMLLDAVGVGLLIPVLPDVLRRFSSDPTTVSQLFGYFIGVYALMQFLASPILGSLSDRYGRRLILLISLLGAAIDYLFMAFAPSLLLLFTGRIISGLSGASMTVASSYMADISDDTNRSANFGMIGAAWGVGFIAGPALGGLVSSFGPKAPFLLAALFNLLNFLFGLFVLPESLDPTHRRHVEFRRLNPLKSITRVLRPSPYFILIWIFFILFLAGQVHPVNWTLYTELKFGWDAKQVGLSLSFVGLTIGLGNWGLTRLMIPRLGESRTLTLGLWVYVIGFALFAFATQGWMMYAIMVFFALSCVAMPALQSIVSRQISASEQGKFQGSLVSLGSLAAILAPILFTKLFVMFTSQGVHAYFPGAAYLGASALCLLTLGLDKMNLKVNAGKIKTLPDSF